MRHVQNLGAGSNGMSLEKIINENHKKILELDTIKNDHRNQIIELKKDAMLTIQKIGVVRFNPFKEVGGNQSFAVAFMDKKKNGLVLSSLYTRDRVNIFAKPIFEGSSEYTLTKEEQEAISKSNK
jgi:hypothetical protein